MDPKEKLGKALYHLLEKKHLHDITVDEIVRALIHEMQRDKKWKKGVIAYGRMLLINIRTFEAYLQSKSY